MYSWSVSSDLRPQTDEETVQAIVRRPPWDYDRVADDEDVEFDDKAWQPHYRKAATLIAAKPQLLGELEAWLSEQSPESGSALGAVLADQASNQAVKSVIDEWLRTERVPNLCAGFCNRYREVHGDLPAWAIAALDEEAASRPAYVARMTCFIDPTERGFDRVFRCVHVPGANRAEVLSRLYGYHWNAALTAERKAAVLAELRRSPEFTVEVEKVFVHLLRMYLHGDKQEALAEPILPHVEFIVKNPPSRAGGHARHEWKTFALRVARTNPTAVLGVSVKLAVNWRHSSNFANEEAIEVLTALCSERRSDVVKAVIATLKTEEHLHFIHLEKWQALFAQFDPAELESEVQPLGLDFIRRIGKLMPDPSVKDGEVRVPSVTEWYLRQYGADDECLSDFEVGRWSGRVRTGWAWQRTAEVEQETQAYLRYPLPALQRWAVMRLERQRKDAERDRITYEEMNNRG